MLIFTGESLEFLVLNEYRAVLYNSHPRHPYHPTTLALEHYVEVGVRANVLLLMPAQQPAQHKGFELHLETLRIATSP